MSTVTPIPLTRPLVGEEEATAAADVVRSGWLTTGPKVDEFETRVAEMLGAESAVAVSNGTTAIELALRVVGVRPGDVVITVSHSFIATANAIRACGAEPVFVDVDVATRNMSAAKLEELLERDFDDNLPPRYRAVAEVAVPPSPLATISEPAGRLGAILVVHQIGLPADVGRLGEIARGLNVPLVEDAACALGSQFRSADGDFEPIGKPHGMACAFSLHPRKVITTGEGGVITFADQALADRARSLRNHGHAAGDRRRFTQTGFNFRMSDIAAAVGCVQLGRLASIVAARRRLATRYADAFADIAHIEAPLEPENTRTNYQSLIAWLADEIDQERVIAELGARKIAAQPGIMCIHLEPSFGRPERTPLPASERAQSRGLTLPLFPQMSDGEVDRVVAALAEILR